ncbi:MAG: hypothetical protein ACXVA9_09530 [Bdellovibrionales bacterium]
MKSLFILGSAMIMVLTAVEPLMAEQDPASLRTSVSDETPVRLSDLDMHLNPQIGVSSFEYSGNTGGGKQKPTGGATVEFGGSARKFETGILLMQTSAETTLNNGQVGTVNVNYLTLPMMAKLRIISMKSQSWYAKFGAMTALALSSSDRNLTNGADVLAGVGLGGRFTFTPKSDLIIEATYNRGLLESVHTSTGSSYNQGFVVLAGLSFSI